jgi:organic hydroperoxide reductase OsmC/OhrA
MLSYLHLCAVAGISVIEYRDQAEGSMELHPDGSGNFTNVTLNPQVKITDDARIADATALHHGAYEKCFIARSVNFPIEHKPIVTA